MTTALYSSSKDDATVRAELSTPSFMDMVQANTGLSVDDPAFQLVDKAALIADIQNGKKTGNLNLGGLSFDHLVFEFQPHEDSNAIAQEIVNFYANPDYIVVKNQGGGKIQQKQVKGQREVLFDLHVKQDGTAHLHILKSHFSVNGSVINPATTCKDTYVIRTEQHLLNQHLEKTLGLQNQISSFVSGGSPNSTYTSPKASPQTKQIVTQAVTKAETVEEYNEIVSKTQNVSIAPNLVSNTISSIDKELAELEEKKNILFETRKLAEGIQIVQNNNTILERKLIDKEKVIEGLQLEKNEVAEQLENRTKSLNAVIEVMGITEYELQESGLSHSEYVKAKLEEKDIDYSNLEEELQGVKAESAKTLADTIAQKDIEKQTAINEIKADFTDKLIAKDVLITEKEAELKEKRIETGKVKIELESTKKVKESLEIQVAEAHKKNADLLSNNNTLADNNKALQAEIDKLKADNAKQMEAFKKEQDEANKKLVEEKQKTAKLERENEEKDKKFREFASKFVNEVGDKLKHLSASIQKLARGITDPEHKKKANDIAKSVKTSISDLTKQYGATDKPKAEDNQGNQNNPFNPNKKKF